MICTDLSLAEAEFDDTHVAKVILECSHKDVTQIGMNGKCTRLESQGHLLYQGECIGIRNVDSVRQFVQAQEDVELPIPLDKLDIKDLCCVLQYGAGNINMQVIDAPYLDLPCVIAHCNQFFSMTY